MSPRADQYTDSFFPGVSPQCPSHDIFSLLPLFPSRPILVSCSKQLPSFLPGSATLVRLEMINHLTPCFKEKDSPPARMFLQTQLPFPRVYRHFPFLSVAIEKQLNSVLRSPDLLGGGVSPFSTLLLAGPPFPVLPEVLANILPPRARPAETLLLQQFFQPPLPLTCQLFPDYASSSPGFFTRLLELSSDSPQGLLNPLCPHAFFFFWFGFQSIELRGTFSVMGHFFFSYFM